MALVVHFWLAAAVMWLAGVLLVPIVLPWALKNHDLSGKWWTFDGFLITFFNACGRFLPQAILAAVVATVVYPFLIARVGRRFPAATARFCNGVAALNVILLVVVAVGVGRAL